MLLIYITMGHLYPLLVAFVVLSWASRSHADVKFVFSVHRHGARNVLPKTSLLKENSAFGGPTLLPQGLNQTYSSGVTFRTRYMNASTCTGTNTCLLGSTSGGRYGVLNAPGVSFHNYNLLARSSALDRALLSSRGFYAGLFPSSPGLIPNNNMSMPDGQQPVPVYSVADVNDYVIRGYTKCPAYDDRLAAWYNTDEFKRKETETQAFRERVKALAPDMDCNLTNWWNVYDAWNVWNSTGLGDRFPPQGYLEPADAAQMTPLANWLEASKMRSSLTGNLLGGPLVSELLDGMSQAARAQELNSDTYIKVMTISSHYNTMLGLLSALALDTNSPAATAMSNPNRPSNWLATGALPDVGGPKIPASASLLVLELFSEQPTSPLLVRLVVQDGPSSPYVTIPLPCSSGSASPAGTCTWPAFQTWASSAALSASDWCKACRNADAATCIQINLQGQLDSSQGSGGHKDWEIAVAVVVTFVGTLLLCGVIAVVVRQRSKRAWSQFEHNPNETKEPKISC
mmetsp:Transcript_13596/g.29101  ORF Transcript_13596/g.29101 Transcript_13596/m.29101 type:complete len:514 (-) Transcript_13596:767-2308(-)